MHTSYECSSMPVLIREIPEVELFVHEDRRHRRRLGPPSPSSTKPAAAPVKATETASAAAAAASADVGHSAAAEAAAPSSTPSDRHARRRWDENTWSQVENSTIRNNFRK